MKRFFIFTAAFLTAGICSLAAQDLIILKNGDMIEAKVMEISPTEIRYKRFERLDGPTIVIPAVDVLSIRYENGSYEVINAPPAAGTERPRTVAQPKSPPTKTIDPDTAIDQEKFIFGINGNAGGALGYIWGNSGTGISVELGKGNFNSEINLMLLRGGFGLLATFNGVWHSQIGGFYLGGGIGFGVYEPLIPEAVEIVDGFMIGNYDPTPKKATSLPVGLNIGYKFVLPSGLYFRTGTFLGFDLAVIWDWWAFPVYIKPDLAIGWTMR